MAGEEDSEMIFRQHSANIRATPTQKQIQAAIDVMSNYGIDFRAPWECTLDDAEKERFEALRDAIGAVLAVTNGERK